MQSTEVKQKPRLNELTGNHAQDRGNITARRDLQKKARSQADKAKGLGEAAKAAIKKDTGVDLSSASLFSGAKMPAINRIAAALTLSKPKTGKQESADAQLQKETQPSREEVREQVKGALSTVRELRKDLNTIDEGMKASGGNGVFLSEEALSASNKLEPVKRLARQTENELKKTDEQLNDSLKKSAEEEKQEKKAESDSRDLTQQPQQSVGNILKGVWDRAKVALKELTKAA